MTNRQTKRKYLYFAVGLLIVALLYYILSPKATKTPIIAEQTISTGSNAFSNQTATRIWADTFKALVYRAYPSFTNCKKVNNILQVNLAGANALTPDFFNGNEALLKYKINDFGFAIQYDSPNKILKADFLIEQESINVPNDVLLRLIGKTYNGK